MSAFRTSEETSAADTTGWWQDDYEDIFAVAADTARQPRPVRRDNVVVNQGAAHEPPPLPPLPPPSVPRRSSPSARSPSPIALPTRRLRVLIADSDPVLQQILGYQFERAGWDVTCTADGSEVLGLLNAGVDALLVDLSLPHRNAYEILEELQGQPGAPRVIVMSAQMQEDKVVRALDLGADDFVHKPLNPRVVASRIQRLLERAS